MAIATPLVVLFDIDETLIHTGGAGARSWMAAFQTIYGIPADIGEHTSAGETDPQVARETFKGVLEREPTSDELGKLFAQYLLALADDIWKSPQYAALPGSEETLQQLGRAGVTLGIVSGAMEGAARTKLEPAKFGRYFTFGSYGSDSPDRPELVTIGLHKASLLHDGLRPDQVMVIGDTPKDITAAAAAGAVSIGVASGHYSVDELAGAGADHVMKSLEETFPGL